MTFYCEKRLELMFGMIKMKITKMSKNGVPNHRALL